MAGPVSSCLKIPIVAGLVHFVHPKLRGVHLSIIHASHISHRLIIIIIIIIITYPNVSCRHRLPSCVSLSLSRKARQGSKRSTAFPTHLPKLARRQARTKPQHVPPYAPFPSVPDAIDAARQSQSDRSHHGGLHVAVLALSARPRWLSSGRWVCVPLPPR